MKEEFSENFNKENPAEEEELLDPKQLKLHFQSHLQALTPEATKKKSKSTNIPKFLLTIFFNNIPKFPD